jgi:hypothetical protein
MTTVRAMPMIGDVLDRPVDPTIKRGYYTNVANALTKITVEQKVIPDVVQQAKPRAGLGDNILEILQKAVQTQGGEEQQKAMPSNLSWRG